MEKEKIINLRTGRSGLVIGSSEYADKRFKKRQIRNVYIVRQIPDGKLTQWAKDSCVPASVFCCV